MCVFFNFLFLLFPFSIPTPVLSAEVVGPRLGLLTGGRHAIHFIPSSTFSSWPECFLKFSFPLEHPNLPYFSF